MTTERISEIGNLAKELRDLSDTLNSGGCHNPALNKAATELETLTQSLAEVTRERDMQIRLDKSTLPCGHNAQYAHSNDGGKNIICTVCRLTTIESANRVMREALEKVRHVLAALAQSSQEAHSHYVLMATRLLKEEIEPALTTPTPSQQCKHGASLDIPCVECDEDKTGEYKAPTPTAERTDGQRLDWLENECENIVPYSTGGPFPKHAHWKVAAYNGNFENESLRAAIDAALRRAERKK